MDTLKGLNMSIGDFAASLMDNGQIKPEEDTASPVSESVPVPQEEYVPDISKVKVPDSFITEITTVGSVGVNMAGSTKKPTKDKFKPRSDAEIRASAKSAYKDAWKKKHASVGRTEEGFTTGGPGTGARVKSFLKNKSRQRANQVNKTANKFDRKLDAEEADFKDQVDHDRAKRIMKRVKETKKNASPNDLINMLRGYTYSQKPKKGEPHYEDNSTKWYEQAVKGADAKKTYGESVESFVSNITRLVEKKVNPWAVCNSSTGNSKSDRFERCVKKVKKDHGVEEGLTTGGNAFLTGKRVGKAASERDPRIHRIRQRIGKRGLKQKATPGNYSKIGNQTRAITGFNRGRAAGDNMRP